jgi:hypothetical protein
MLLTASPRQIAAMRQEKNENRRSTPSLFCAVGRQKPAHAGVRFTPNLPPATPAANNLNGSKLSGALLPISGSFLTRE